MLFISVIIPAFNAERWLERTLLSVKEAIDSECEVIIVNDGSTDDTHEIARRFVDEDPRFNLIDIEHAGPCAARKAGFMESTGDYVLFVDSDDLLPANSIIEQRKLIEARMGDPDKDNSERPKIVVSNTLARTGDVDRLLISGSTRTLTGMEFAYELLKRTLPGFFPGHFYDRELVAAIDWDDSPQITHQENFYLLFSLTMKLNEMEPDKRRVLVVPSFIGYHYMRRAGSQSALMALTLKGLERVWKHINKLGLPEPELTLWGMDVLYNVFISRGIPFPSNYYVAADLRRRGRNLGKSMPEDYREKFEALGSLKKRTRIAAELARSAGLTSIRPHLSVIIVCRHTVPKVERSVASVFAMGFRNLEVVVVDMDNTHSEQVALNSMSIRYARVRIVKAEPETDMFHAAQTGLKAAEGLSVAFVRPGDLCRAGGLYEAVTRIDYGADVVFPNYVLFDPMTRLRSNVLTSAHLRTTEESRNATETAANSTENIYKVVKDAIENDGKDGNRFFVYGLVWRTDFLKDKEIDPDELLREPAHTIGHAYLRHLLAEPLRIVTQDKTSPPAFMFASDNFFVRMFRNLLPTRKGNKGLPETYIH